MTTVTDQTVHRQRAAALTTLAQLAHQHDLPMPMTVNFFDETYDRRKIELRLDADRPGSVSDWAKVIGLGEPTSTHIGRGEHSEPFTAVVAKMWSYGGPPLWLGFDSVEVWSACRAETTQAENGDDYSREPDNADNPQPVPSGVDGGPIGSGPGRTTGGA